MKKEGFEFYYQLMMTTIRMSVWLIHRIQDRLFGNRRTSVSPFIAEPFLFFKDYNGIIKRNGEIRSIWTRQDGSKLTIQTAIVNLNS